MQIIIPMSGFGERFRRAGYAVPKPLIEVDGKTIIEHVVDMFPGEANITFICNEDHLADPAYRMRETLERCCPTARIVAIAPHKLGPVNAVLQAADGIDDDEPVIVNYCDFTCYWDYDHFRRFVAATGCDGAIPCYRGFHPHSLGSTYYAYVQEADGWAYGIQEKHPYTATPMNEYASSGTYYYRSGRLLKEMFAETVARNIAVNGEHYASLAYVPMFERGMKVAVYELQHFMQWGTPADLLEYNQHDRQFRALSLPRGEGACLPGTLLLPMAGSGARFADRGYADPKPLIAVSGRPMALAAMACLPQTPAQRFVLRRDQPEVDRIVAALKACHPSGKIVMLDGETGGQAATCLAGLDGVDFQEPLTIGACDTGQIYDAGRLTRLFADSDCDVIVWGFRGHYAARRHPEHYGWIACDGDVVNAVSVKRPLNDPARDPVVTGTFTFRRAGDFQRAAERMMATGRRTNGEYYVDSCINDAIAMGLKVRLFEIDSYLCWGTPDELNTFEYWQSCFHKWPSHPYRLARDEMISLDSINLLERRYAPVRPSLPLRDARSGFHHAERAA